MARKSSKSDGGKAKTKSGKLRKVGSTFTKTLEQGPNKGERVTFKVAPSRKPFPIKGGGAKPKKKKR